MKLTSTASEHHCGDHALRGLAAITFRLSQQQFNNKLIAISAAAQDGVRLLWLTSTHLFSQVRAGLDALEAVEPVQQPDAHHVHRRLEAGVVALLREHARASPPQGWRLTTSEATPDF